MKHCYQISILIILTVSLFVSGLTQNRFQYNAAAERRFTQALQLFQREEFSKSLIIFDSLLNQKPIHQRTTAAYIMAGKTLHHMKQYNASIIILSEFLNIFPTTSYSDDAKYTLALNEIMLQRYEEAANHLIQCLEVTNDSQIMTRASSLLESIADNQLTVENLINLIEKAGKVDVKDQLSVILAEKYFNDGEQYKADNILDGVLSREVKSKYDNQARSLKDRFTAKKNIKIGVVLPLMKNISSESPVKIISEELLSGMAIALEEVKLKSKSLDIVTLEVRDSERDSMIAKAAVKELSNLNDVLAIIGPLHSNLAVACAKVADNSGVPLIVPIASTNGIAALGRTIYQANPDMRNRGKIMARYAVSEMGLKNVAILASSESIGRALAESFNREVKRLGGNVIAFEYYARESSDLSEQFINIRNVGFKLARRKEAGDDTQVPLRAIDGLFIAIADADEIGVIASQIKYFNIETHLLGSNEWYAPLQLESNKSYLNGLIFQTDSFQGDSNPSYQEFERIYLSKNKKHPTKYSLIGYDTMHLLLDQIKEGADTREKLIRALDSVESFPGLHGKITFKNGRVNSEMHILQFNNGEIQKVAELSIE